MKVSDLITELQTCNPDAIVVMSADEEGNSYSPLSAFSDIYNYIPESTWSGGISIRELTPELEEEGYTEDDVLEDEDSVPCVVLWPTN